MKISLGLTLAWLAVARDGQGTAPPPPPPAPSLDFSVAANSGLVAAIYL